MTPALRRRGSLAGFSAVALCIALLTGSCSSDSAPQIEFPQGSASSGRLHPVAPGLAIRLPPGWSTVPVALPPYDHPEECGAITYAWTYQRLPVVHASLPPKVCATQRPKHKPLNDHHGAYNSATDAFAPHHVTKGSVRIGDTTIFDQEYTECTNSCRTTTDRVGLVHLRTPVDDEHRTLQLWAPTDEVSAAQMRALLSALQVES